MLELLLVLLPTSSNKVSFKQCYKFKCGEQSESHIQSINAFIVQILRTHILKKKINNKYFCNSIYIYIYQAHSQGGFGGSNEPSHRPQRSAVSNGTVHT